MILVVGATGQLGTAVVRRLAAWKQLVRAFVRPTSNHQHLRGPGIELAFGDLRDAASVDKASEGVTTVIATANTVVPRANYSFEQVEGLGYQNLLNSSRRNHVKQLIFMSVPVTPYDDKVLTFRYKRLIEQTDSEQRYSVHDSPRFVVYG